MRRLINERRKSTGVHPDGPIFKERRKAYYHGKYNNRVLPLLILISCIAVFMVRQGI